MASFHSRVLRRTRLNVTDGNADVIVVVITVTLAVLVVTLRLLLMGELICVILIETSFPENYL